MRLFGFICSQLLLLGTHSFVTGLPSNDVASRQVATGTLSFNTAQTPFTFDYFTSRPNEKNWVGLYRASGGGPVDQKYVAASLVWQYAPAARGSVSLSTSNLQPGAYRAFYLARDGYEWLANPINVTLQAPAAALYFPVGSATLHNARRGERYAASVDGFLLGRGSENVAYQKLSGAAWIQVGSNGQLTGTPDNSAATNSQVSVRASTASGSTAELSVTVPVKGANERLVSDLRVMSFNLWFGGTRVNKYFEKQLRFIIETNTDIIAFQESGPSYGAQIASALGWQSYQESDVSIISRYPIVQRHSRLNAAGGVRIDLNGGRTSDAVDINIWSAHLGYTPYGPYDFCFDNMSKERVLQREAQSGRTPQITDIMNGLAPQLQNSARTPVILAGDFNAPSHLDWIPALATKNCGIDRFDWPTSVLPIQRGLLDSFRIANPDPVAVQGTTWSPVYPKHDGATGRDEPQDRIDFVYHSKDRLTVVSSQALVRGAPQASPGHADNEWTSDHAAVLTHYRVQ